MYYSPDLTTEEQRNAARGIEKNIGQTALDNGLGIFEVTGGIAVNEASALSNTFGSAGHGMQGIWEDSYQTRIRELEDGLVRLENQMAKARYPEQLDYWRGRINGQKQAIERAKASLKDAQNFKEVVERIDEGTDWLKTEGDYLIEQGKQDLPPGAAPIVDATTEIVPSIVEYKLNPALGIAASYGRGAYKAKQSGADEKGQMAAGLKEAAGAGAGVAVSALVHLGPFWKTMAKANPAKTKALEEIVSYILGTGTQYGTSAFLNLFKSPSPKEPRNIELEELSHLKVMGSLAHFRKTIKPQMRNQAWNFNRNLETMYGVPKVGEIEFSPVQNSWKQEWEKAAEKIIMEYWDEMSTGIPVEDALEANRTYLLFAVLLIDLNRRRRMNTE